MGQFKINCDDNAQSMKILIDRNIEINARTHKSVSLPKSIQWGDTNITCDVLERVACLPALNEAFKAEQLPYLATICLMAKAETVTFYSTDELRMERLRQKGWRDDEGYVGLNLLRDVKIKCVRSPVERTIVFAPFGRSIGTTEDEQMEFFRSITTPRFIHIRNVIGEAQIDDAFHLWAAEVAQLDIFLTMDKKFWNNVTQKKHQIDSTVAVLTPKELCQRLNAEPTNIEALAAQHPPFC